MRPSERDQKLAELDREAVQRQSVSESSRTAFAEARAAGDTQQQLDIIWDILTGEQPDE